MRCGDRPNLKTKRPEDDNPSPMFCKEEKLFVQRSQYLRGLNQTTKITNQDAWPSPPSSEFAMNRARFILPKGGFLASGYEGFLGGISGPQH